MDFRIEVGSDADASNPFDVGFQSGMSGRTLFDCPYDHKNPEGLRSRHEWLNGYMTALASARVMAPF